MINNYEKYFDELNSMLKANDLSDRRQDIQDVGEIIKKLGIKTPEDFYKIIKQYNFHSIDESLVLEAFGNAYGMKWLEDYYIQHIEPTDMYVQGDNDGLVWQD